MADDWVCEVFVLKGFGALGLSCRAYIFFSEFKAYRFCDFWISGLGVWGFSLSPKLLLASLKP